MGIFALQGYFSLIVILMHGDGVDADDGDGDDDGDDDAIITIIKTNFFDFLA